MSPDRCQSIVLKSLSPSSTIDFIDEKSPYEAMANDGQSNIEVTDSKIREDRSNIRGVSKQPPVIRMDRCKISV